MCRRPTDLLAYLIASLRRRNSRSRVTLVLRRRNTHYEGRSLRSESGSLAKFAAMRRASPPVSRLVAASARLILQNKCMSGASRQSWLSHSRAWGDCPAIRALRGTPHQSRERIRSAPIPIFPRSGHFDGASAEVGFSPFFCLSHSRDFRHGPHNPLDLTCAGLARAVKIEVAREDLREAITYQKSTTSRPVSAAPRTSIDQSPASRPKRRSAAVLARITGLSQRFEGEALHHTSWNDPVTTSV